MAPASSFSPDQLTWIIYKYGELKSVVSVMRAYRKQFYPKNPYLVPSKASFYRVLDRFEHSGGNAKPKQRSGMGLPDDHVRQVEDYFRNHNNAHLREFKE